jgi:hypothetical protein
MFWECREFGTSDISNKRMLFFGMANTNQNLVLTSCFQLLHILANNYYGLVNLEKVTESHICWCIVCIDLKAETKHENTSKQGKKKSTDPNYKFGRAIAQAVSRRLPTAAARVGTCDFVMDKSGAGAGFLRELRFPLPIYIPSCSTQSSSLSPEAATIGQECPQCL